MPRAGIPGTKRPYGVVSSSRLSELEISGLPSPCLQAHFAFPGGSHFARVRRMSDPADATLPVRRRQVIYIPGYDPFPPRRYRELYRTEGAKQAAISGYQIAMKGDPKQGGTRWDVQTDIEGVQVETQMQVMIWSDIVQASMDRGVAATYWLMVRTAWIYIRTGALRGLMRLRPGPMFAALYPVAMLLVQLLAALTLAISVGTLLSWLVWPPLFWLAAVVVSVAVLQWFKRNDRRLYAYYLMHDYAFSADHNGALAPAMAPRLKEFGESIAAALTKDVDEVLVVGHSSGADIAVMVFADLLRNGRLDADGPAVSLLTLGQVIPMTSFLPEATQLRTDLHLMAAQDRVVWVDVSAPGDGASFALCDPVSVSGVAPPNKRWPLVISAAFSQTLAPETLAATRWRFFRRHAQYLCAFDNPGEYDYFRITAGPKTLAARFGHRKPSASRIETPLSPHTKMAS